MYNLYLMVIMVYQCPFISSPIPSTQRLVIRCLCLCFVMTLLAKIWPYCNFEGVCTFVSSDAKLFAAASTQSVSMSTFFLMPYSLLSRLFMSL